MPGRKIEAFRGAVYDVYAGAENAARRELPWRLCAEPWAVLISEFMLQQTQVERVVPYWKRWLDLWPNPAALARAPLQDALREWLGLGYNRRCHHLWQSARQIEEEFSGVVPDTPQRLLALPGVGPYGAGAISCFAYNKPSVFIETNIRAATLHFFYRGREGVRDAELYGILEEALDRSNPRLWYWALMDYGAAVKKAAGNPNRRSAHYMRQSRFAGSFRQQRGLLLRTLVSSGPVDAAELQRTTGLDGPLFYQVACALERDMLVCSRDGMYYVAPNVKEVE